MSNYMITYSGKKVNPMQLRKNEILIEDIGHALSLLCRGGGHLKYFYSVAQHSINCAMEAKQKRFSTKVVLGCLLHDASEAYLSDIIRPVKQHLENYLEIEAMLQNRIWSKFSLADLSDEEYRKIYLIDDIMLENELAILMNGSVDSNISTLESNPDFSLRESKVIKEQFILLAKELEKQIVE